MLYHNVRLDSRNSGSHLDKGTFNILLTPNQQTLNVSIITRLCVLAYEK